MRTALLAFLCFLLPFTATTARTLSEAEVVQLKADITSMMAAFEQGEAQPLIDRTHASLQQLAGGHEAFAKITRQAVGQLLQTGVRFVESEVGAPTQTYLAGDEEVCFVPRTSTLEIQGKKAKSTTFMVAIKRLGSSEWKYLDGAGLRKRPDNLYVLLPKLEHGIELPPNKIEAE